jgi:hypothetical protein
MQTLKKLLLTFGAAATVAYIHAISTSNNTPKPINNVVAENKYNELLAQQSQTVNVNNNSLSSEGKKYSTEKWNLNKCYALLRNTEDIKECSPSSQVNAVQAAKNRLKNTTFEPVGFDGKTVISNPPEREPKLIPKP